MEPRCDGSEPEPRLVEPQVIEPQVMESRETDLQEKEPRLMEPRVIEPQVMESRETDLQEKEPRLTESKDTELRCSHCGAPIERQAKGYKRKSLLSLTDLRSASRLFPDLNPVQAFLCFSCVRLVYNRTKKSGKKRVFVDPQAARRPAPPRSVPEEPPPPKKLKPRQKAAPNEHDYASQDSEPAARPEPPQTRRLRRGPIPRICRYLQKKNLSSALNLLLQVTGFRTALIRTCSRIIGQERKALVSDLQGPFRRTFSPEALAAFSWDQTTSWAQHKAPLTLACLRATFPPDRKLQKQTAAHGVGGEAAGGPEDQRPAVGVSVQQLAALLLPADGVQPGDAAPPLPRQALQHHQQPRTVAV
ncbi:uncharacterized protein LOC103353908 [Stegastes partitus]|uniref:Uncharacterized protein LOC103353908 n=1 Tax=Stegastes partitus TaxID=144197 RepID=A0A9Y4JQ83_9TELE|nr:PREDICTED: uncharacterized protein LOC103353908 [Stegastes partitus]